ncbi:MAG TPA: ABC transporter substrate-binding protein [Jiangellaceae bacterium]|nr:ABC transporter substrate-binding protein [Jiangellaceae bacterium]
MKRRRYGALALMAASALVLAACGSDGNSSDGDAPDGADVDEVDDVGGEEDEELADAEALVQEYPRAETVFTSGQQWGPPSSWNPIPQSGEATGVRGLLYEPLFMFHPNTLELEPWLAESGEWVSDDVYELTLRDGLTWSDGEALTADDVVFTIELGHHPEVPWANVWNWLDDAEAIDDLTVRYTFSDPRYEEWDNFLYTNNIVPEHIVGEWSEDDYIGNQNEDPIGSGAYLYSTHAADRMVWERNEDWWGIEALDMHMPARYIVDIVNPSNEVALGLLLQGQLDLSNNFLPGINTLVDSGQVETYFPEAPYMLSENTAALFPNLLRAPMDDVAFRQALAHAIDVDQIVSGAYANIVEAAHPSGLLPAYEEFYDDAVTAEHGFTHDPDKARSILADAGYEDTDGDGLVESPDGDAIELSLIVPAGWTDWMEAARVIAEGAQEVGINVVADFPDAGALDDARATGEFDLLLNNFSGVSNTPWTWYNYVFHQPIQEQMLPGNFGRYENDEAWDLVQELSRTAQDEPEYQEIMSQLQEITMTELPMIPLWYNGMWAQYNTQVWTNWPTSDPSTPDYFPNTWGGGFHQGGLHTLAEIEPAG